jgi:hypothetical protein
MVLTKENQSSHLIHICFHLEPDMLDGITGHLSHERKNVNMSCLINYLVHELASRQGDALKVHQAKLEQS